MDDIQHAFELFFAGRDRKGRHRAMSGPHEDQSRPVGTGGWGTAARAHLLAAARRRLLRRSTGRNRERTEARAAEYGVRAYTDIAEMLETEKPDLVSLCLPNQGHFDADAAGHPGRLPAAGREAAGLRPGRSRHAAGRGRRSATSSSPSTSTIATPSPCSWRTRRSSRAAWANSSSRPGASAARAAATIRTPT